MECDDLQAKYDDLVDFRSALQAQIRNPATPRQEREDLRNQLKKLEPEITRAKSALDECLQGPATPTREIGDWQTLLGAVQPFLDGARPLDALRATGVKLVGSVAEGLAAHQGGGRSFDPAVAEALTAALGPPPPIRLHVGRGPQIVARQVGGYGAVASADLKFFNEVLATLWRVNTIRQELTLDQSRKLISAKELGEACTGVPEGADIGPFRITGPPVLSAGMLNQRNIHLQVPFNLVLAGPTPASLVGVVHAELELLFDLDRDQVCPSPDSYANATVSLVVSPSSPVQPASETGRGALEARFKAAIFAVFFHLHLNRKLCAPGVVTPARKRYPNSHITITAAGAATVHVERPSVVDYVNVGILVRTPGIVDAAALVGAERPAGPSNVHIVIDQGFATDALAAVIDSGDLADFFNRVIRRHSQGLSVAQIEVRRGQVTFHEGSMRIVLDCTAVDACTLGKDLSFTATVSGPLVVVDGELTFQSSAVDFDLDNSDAVVCTLLSVILGPFSILIHTAVMAFIAAYNPDGKDIRTPTAFAKLLPGSERDAVVRLNHVALAPGRLTVDGTAEVVDNQERLFTYLRILQGWPVGSPVAGATVELIELDSPPPPGDDVAVPEPIDRTEFTEKHQITESGSYEPLNDHSLGTAISDENGFVAFAAIVQPTAGIYTYTKTIEEIVSGGQVSTDTTHRVVPEAQPDLGVSVVSANGDVLARRLPIAVNVADKRLGRREAPFEVRVSQPVVEL